MMRTFLRTITFGTVLAALGIIHLTAQAADPLVGTWELNLAKSTYKPGPAPRSETRTYVVAAEEIKATAKGVQADGTPTSGQWTVNYNGKDRPITGTSRSARCRRRARASVRRSTQPTRDGIAECQLIPADRRC